MTEEVNEKKTHIYALRTTANREDQVMDFLSSNVTRKGLGVYCIIRPHGMRSYIFLEAISRAEAEVRRFPVTLEIASSPMSLAMLKKFRMEVADTDILHYHFPWPFADLAHILSKPNKMSVVTYHSDILRQKKLKYGRVQCYNQGLKKRDPQ